MRRRERRWEIQEKGWRGATVQRIYNRGRQDADIKSTALQTALSWNPDAGSSWPGLNLSEPVSSSVK